MDDRDLDDRLRRRLRAYESRLPETDAPDPRGIRPRNGVRWPAVAGVLGAAVVVGVVGGTALLLNRPSAPIGEVPPTTSPSAAGVEELALDTARRDCPGSPDQLLAIYGIPNGEAFWTIFPEAGLAPELAPVQVPLLVVVYDGRYVGSTFGGFGAPMPSAPAPGTADVCIETADGSETLASSSYGVYLDIPLPPHLAVASPDPTSSARPTASPSPSPIPTATPLSWHEVASFGSAETMQQVNGVVSIADRFVAVGTEYFAPFPEVFGTPPHRGQIWVSPDGSSWEPLTLNARFDDVDLSGVFVVGGAAVAFGTHGDEEVDSVQPVAFRSTDGLTWEPQDVGLPARLIITDLEQGARGYLAAGYDSLGCCSGQAWHSIDGQIWQHVDAALGNDVRIQDVGAGDEGFVVIGLTVGEGERRTVISASADGVTWVPAINPPAALNVAPHEDDWVAVGVVFDERADDRLWSSANGLDWTEIPLDMETVTLQDFAGTCREIPTALHGADGWLIMEVQLTSWTIMCGEGGVFRYGTPRISADGVTWTPLPFPDASSGRHRGSAVHDLLIHDNTIVAAGASQYTATFWIGESP